MIFYLFVNDIFILLMNSWNEENQPALRNTSIHTNENSQSSAQIDSCNNVNASVVDKSTVDCIYEQLPALKGFLTSFKLLNFLTSSKLIKLFCKENLRVP